MQLEEIGFQWRGEGKRKKLMDGTVPSSGPKKSKHAKAHVNNNHHHHNHNSNDAEDGDDAMASPPATPSPSSLSSPESPIPMNINGDMDHYMLHHNGYNTDGEQHTHHHGNSHHHGGHHLLTMSCMEFDISGSKDDVFGLGFSNSSFSCDGDVDGVDGDDGDETEEEDGSDDSATTHTTNEVDADSFVSSILNL